MDPARYAGVKLIPHLSGVPDAATLDRIRQLRLPVLVHGGTHSPPRFIERAILPKISGPLIVAHLGSFPCNEPLMRDAVDLARRRENVYLDTSGVWIAAFLRYAAKRVPEKLMFGSDAPLAHPLIAWRHVASVVRDDRKLERIGSATAREVHG